MTHYRVEQPFSSATSIGAPVKGSIIVCDSVVATEYVRLGWLSPLPECKPKTPSAEKKPRKPRTVKPKD